MKSIRIGTRNSPLALWQAREVARHLQNLNYKTEITPIVSTGDQNLTQPLYSMGITGVFTRDLDIALLNDEIDIAVHSLKDVPTVLPENIELIAFLERDYNEDVLIRSNESKGKDLKDLKIATSSLRRRAFWLSEYPNTDFYDIRGNVHTRLQKLETEVYDATMFSLAGIKRIKIPVDYEILPMMISAPAQGVIAVAGNINNIEINEILKKINHRNTEVCVEIERNFLNMLEGGCTAPIGAYAHFIDDETIHFIARLSSLDGTRNLELNERFTCEKNKNYGKDFALQLLNRGGNTIMKEIKETLS